MRRMVVREAKADYARSAAAIIVIKRTNAWTPAVRLAALTLLGSMYSPAAHARVPSFSHGCEVASLKH